MEFLSVGERRDEWRDFPDGYILSYDAHNGLTLFFFLENPSEHVLRQVRKGSSFEIAVADIEKVGFFTLRFGTLPYGDCAFAPCLFMPAPPPQRPEEGGGLTLNVIVIDSGQGVIAYMRSITLGYEFSAKLSNWFQNRMGLEMSGGEYRRIVKSVYARYGTEELRNLANISWRYSGERM